MKTRVVAVIMVLALVQIAFAGGILTNTNQSVQFVRMLSRNASTQIDAVYFNPAGMTQLPDGFFFAIHSQTIIKEKIITSTFPALNSSKYQGDTFVPVFPDFYAVYKKDKFAAAFNFSPIAGGGTADFKKGIPDLEQPFSLIPMGVSAQGIPTTAYSADLAFKGSSIYYGFQVNASYAVTEKVSLSLGGRYNIAKNVYTGSLKNIMINPNMPALGLDGSMIPASAFFTAIGDPISAAALGDQEVDAEQTGTGITPIVGLNIKLNSKVNIGLKYELATKMELTNKTTKDLIASPQFPDGEKKKYDIPAILAGGISFQVSEPLVISVGGNYYFDKDADWAGHEKLVDSNTWEYQIGAEYAVNDKFTVSAGFQHTESGVSAAYQSGLSYDLSADAIGAGARVCFNENLALELGGLYTIYKPMDVNASTMNIPYKVTYDETTWLVAVGLEYAITK